MMKFRMNNCFSKKFFFGVLMLFSAITLSAQMKAISGVVKDASGEPVIGASLLVEGTSIGAVTDLDGAYNLNVPASGKTLVVSYIGMTTKKVAINGSLIDVKLETDSKTLDVLVVTGYGTTKKRDLVTSVGSISAEQLKDVPVSSAAEAIQGKLAGVNVVTTEGSPDASVKIRVRGGSSLTQGTDPLYIVDGFPVSNINDIAPSDIQSMDVLKDAAATAIYGAQGANGVIIVTTKDSKSDGDSNKMTVDYTGYVGWKKMAKKYDMLNNRDFTLMQYEYAYLTKGKDELGANFAAYFDQYYHDNGSDKNFQTPINDLLDYWGAQPNTDWQDKTFGRTGFNSNHSVSVSGGNKNANFNASYNRIDDKGIMQESNFIRNNLSLKAKFQPVKNLTIGFTTRFTNTEVLGSGASTADDAGSKTESRVRNAVAYTPIALLSKDETNLDEDSFGSLFNPLVTITDNYKYKVDDKWTMSGYASYKFAKYYTFRTDLGYESREIATNRFYGPTTYYSRAGDGFTYGGGVTGKSSAFLINEKSSKLRNTNTLEFKKSFNKVHNFSALLGEETIVNKMTTTTSIGSGYEGSLTAEDVFNYFDQATYRYVKNYIEPTDNALSFFGRVNYDYKGRYYLTATMRGDGSTRFQKGNQWGYFPSLAAAWRVSDESFMESTGGWLSNLKTRLSFGMAGNNNIPPGFGFMKYESNKMGYMEGFVTSLAPGGSDKIAANPKLKWETTTTRNFGIDYGFFKDRLSGTIDIYMNSTDDLLLKYKLPAYYSLQYRNIGSTENKGLEFSVRGVILDKQSKNLSYGLTLDANMSLNKNEITSLGGMDTYPVSTEYFGTGYANADAEFMGKVGESVGQIYGYKTNGWYTTSDFASYNASSDKWLDANGKEVVTMLGKARPGMMKLVTDEAGNAQRTILGCTMPTLTGGFSLSGNIGSERWGKFDMNANFTYSYGNEILNLSSIDYSTIFNNSKLRNNTSNVAYGSRYSLFTGEGAYIPASAITDASGMVTGDNYTALSNQLSQANKGATIYNPVSEKIALTDQAVEDGSFIRLNSLTIGYSLPSKWINKAYISNARFFMTASNLFCITKYSGSDPEVDTGSKRNPLALGVDFSAYPKSTGFNIGVNLTF